MLKKAHVVFAIRLVMPLALLSPVLSSVRAATRAQEDLAVNLGVSIEYVQDLEDRARQAQIELRVLHMALQHFSDQLVWAQRGELFGGRAYRNLVGSLRLTQKELETFPQALQRVAQVFPQLDRPSQTIMSRELFWLDLATTLRLLRAVSGRP